MKKVLILILVVFISGCISNSSKIEYNPPVDMEKKIETFRMGQNILIDGVSYKVDSIEAYNEIGESEVSQRTEGWYYLVHLTIKNEGIPEGYVFSPGVKLIDENGMKYNPDLRTKFYLSNIINWEKVLVTGAVHSGVLVFDVPKGVKISKLEIRNDWKEVEKIYIETSESRIIFKDIMEEVVKAREENELLKAKIN
ncbi:MAG: DUF4352 domain-containing protein [Nanoarchaeota archaeon]|nr:DUF4352 domain-containing protein [Nanoarchaeota archaeon]